MTPQPLPSPDHGGYLSFETTQNLREGAVSAAPDKGQTSFDTVWGRNLGFHRWTDLGGGETGPGWSQREACLGQVGLGLAVIQLQTGDLQGRGPCSGKGSWDPSVLGDLGKSGRD